MQDALHIPKDLETCQALVVTLASSLAAYEEKCERLEEAVSESKLQIQRLMHLLYGRRSERRIDSPDQQRIDFGDEPPAPPQEEVVLAPNGSDDVEEALVRDLLERRKERQQRQKERGSQALPPHLKRVDKLIDLAPEQKDGLTHIGDDVSERLVFEPPKMWVERITRPKYVRKNEPAVGVRQAPAPLAIVEGCRFDFSVIAQVAYAKYYLHSPLYRQQDDLARLGWNPSRSTLCHLVGLAADALWPLVVEFLRILLSQDLLGLDETHINLLCPEANGGSKETQAWLLMGREEAPLNVFHHSLSREQRHVDRLLAGYSGIVIADCYTAYNNISTRSDRRIVHAACNAHARRKFVEAEPASPRLAAESLAFYRRLYDVEERGKLLTVAERLNLRQQVAVPIWDAFLAWTRSDSVTRLLPKHKMTEAVGYLERHEEALRRYLSDGRIPIDNNDVERTLRGLTIGRKNWLFLGSEQGGQRMSAILSVVSSAARHNLDVYQYLLDCLRRLAYARQHAPDDLQAGSDLLTSLLPYRWVHDHPASIRTARVQEKQLAGEAKRLRRARAKLLEQAKRRASN